jgi:hypothetical protein
LRGDHQKSGQLPNNLAGLVVWQIDPYAEAETTP